MFLTRRETIAFEFICVVFINIEYLSGVHILSLIRTDHLTSSYQYHWKLDKPLHLPLSPVNPEININIYQLTIYFKPIFHNFPYITQNSMFFVQQYSLAITYFALIFFCITHKNTCILLKVCMLTSRIELHKLQSTLNLFYLLMN